MFYYFFIYNINKQEWIQIDNNFNNFFVYDIDIISDYIYIATNKGLLVYSHNDGFLTQNNIFSIFEQFSIVDLEVIGSRLYIASDIGLFEYNSDQNQISNISNNVYKKIESDNENNLYVSKKNKLFRINKNNIDYLASIKNIKDICLCNDFLWVNNFKYSTLLNLRTNEMTEYNELDGLLSNRIHDIQCDESWVWFSSNNGLVLYNWSKYHNHEK